jgi:hypothetical protein
MWLKADAGTTENGGVVSVWADQSGNGADATQVNEDNRPTLITTSTGKPGIHFSGSGQYLNFYLPVEGLTGMTIAVVSANYPPRNGLEPNWGPNDPAENSTLIAWPEPPTGNWSGVYLNSFQTNLFWRFGTTEAPNGYKYNRPVSIGAAASTTIVVKNVTTESLYVNGVNVTNVTVADGTLGGPLLNSPNGRLGKATWTDSYFAGDIMEVLVYSTGLSSAQVAELQAYFDGKYFSGGTAAVSLSSPDDNATITAPGSITMVADTSLTVGTVTNVEFFDGATLVGHKTTAPFVYTLANASLGDHVLTAKVTLSGGASATSGAKTVHMVAGSGGPTFDGLAMWYRADSGVVMDAQNPSGVLLWADQSGNGVDATQFTVAAQPTVITSGTGRTGIHFNGAGQHMNFTFPVNGLEAISLVLVSANYPQQNGAAGAGAPPENNVTLAWPEDPVNGNWTGVYLSSFQTNVFWRLGTYQVPNGYSYARSESTGADASTTILVRDGTAATESLYVDGELATQVDTDPSYPTLDGTLASGYLARAGYYNTYFAGDILEVLVYTNALSDTVRNSIQQYLHAKYFANQPPTVTLVDPLDYLLVTSPGDVSLLADVSDDGSIAKVEFIDGETLIGTRTNAPWGLTWNQPPVGVHIVTAKATDNQGATGLSAPVSVFVYSATGFFPLETFETRTVGGINGQGGWSSLKSIVGVDATDSKNKVLGVPSNNDLTFFPILLPQGSTGTFFLRVYSQNTNPTDSNGDNLHWGFSDVKQPTATTDFEVQLCRKTLVGSSPADLYGDNIGNRPLLGYQILTNFVPFTWYKLWLVVDNEADTYKVYMQGGELTEQTQLIGDSYYESNPFVFRNGQAGNDLASFFVATSAHLPTAPFQIDDLYMALGEDLSDPLALPVEAPRLSIVRAGDNAVVSWPAAASSYSLESTTSLSAPNWSAVSQTAVLTGDQMTVTLPISQGPMYLRLRK